MSSDYPVGSEWRKWDLHLHSPKSIVQEYGGDTRAAWDKFLDEIARLPTEVKAIAITDYLFIDGYEYVLANRDKIPNIDLILLNIEFRLDTFSGKDGNTKRHNFHVIFDPSVDVQDIRDQLLNGLSNGYTIADGQKWQKTPTVRSLEELGKQIKSVAPAGNTVHSKSDLEVGFDNITYSREDIAKLLEKDCFKGKYLTAMGYSEWDQSRWDQSAAEKRDLINSSDFCLTSLDDAEKINENIQDLKENHLTSIVLHSSDAHKLDRVGQTKLWIKADPTFAGLKQVLNEPETRVYIGDTPPNYKVEHKVISSVAISKSNGWFEEDFELKLNDNLVTLIGGRGSGKSALAEAIAYGAGSLDTSQDAFLKKANIHKFPIKGADIKLTWRDGTVTQHEVGTLANDHELVRFLPQGAVEELCSPNNGEKLQKQIENVIFQALDETERLGASDFDELKTRILSDFQYEKEEVAKSIRDINQELATVLATLHGKPQKEATLKTKQDELKKLIDTLPKLPEGDKKEQEDLSKLIDLKRKFEQKIVSIQQLLGSIGEVRTRIKVFKTQIDDFQRDISTPLSNLGIDEASFSVSLDDEKIEEALQGRKTQLDGQLTVLKSGSKTAVAELLNMEEADLLFPNLSTLSAGIVEKQQSTRAFETTKLKYQQQKAQIAALEASIKALEDEIQKVDTEVAPRQSALEGRRLEAYHEYFVLLGHEKDEIEKLYQPLQSSLSAGTETDRKLVFEAKIDYKMEAHVKEGLAIIDRTRKGNFREAGSLENILRLFWERNIGNEMDNEEISKGMGQIIDAFHTFDDAPITIKEQLREGFGYEDFYNWLFDPTHFETVSSLKFNGTDLYVLSPGQKGIILLILYLEIDKADYRPLIIDQPEENLDNLSIYKDLMRYFRDRKQYRQIIMVTHNPNLVVNTDAEQVIVASYDGSIAPRLTYDTGSLEDRAQASQNGELEDDGIIKQVCDILEGGEDAFEKRKKKYKI